MKALLLTDLVTMTGGWRQALIDPLQPYGNKGFALRVMAFNEYLRTLHRSDNLDIFDTLVVLFSGTGHISLVWTRRLLISQIHLLLKLHQYQYHYRDIGLRRPGYSFYCAQN